MPKYPKLSEISHIMGGLLSPRNIFIYKNESGEECQFTGPGIMLKTDPMNKLNDFYVIKIEPKASIKTVMNGCQMLMGELIITLSEKEEE